MDDRREIYNKGGILEKDRVALDRVLDELDSAGLNYSFVAGRGDTENGVGIALEGGINSQRAFRVGGFIDEVMTNKEGVVSNVLERRRYLLNYVTDELEKKGAEVLERTRNEKHGSAIDSIHMIKLEGRVVRLCLMYKNYQA